MVERNSGMEVAARRKVGARPLLVFLFILFAVVAAAVIAGALPRLTKQKAMQAASGESGSRKPMVLVSTVKYAPASSSVELPGDLQAQIESPIFARTDGYLKERRAELGDHVKAGDVMAVLETPEIDQQILQAQASLAQTQAALKELEADIELAKANANLSKVTLDRWEHLAQKGAVSKQERDEKNADYEVKKAQADRADASLSTARQTVRAAEANVRRLQEMQKFSTVLAPFDGIVTAREVDVGWLISAGSGSLTSKEMFRVAKVTPMRIFVNVPQAYSGMIFDGQTAELRVQERPGTVFPARVSHSSHEIETGSRSMLSILVTPNERGELLPGMYAQVRFNLSNAKPLLRIPGDTVMTTKNGPRVAVVGGDQVVHFKSVALGQDFGSEVEVVSGLHEGDVVVSNPGDFVQDGVAVDTRERK